MCYTLPMKVNRITLIAQAVGMYLMHTPLYLFFLLEFSPLSGSLSIGFIKGLITVTFIFMGLLSPICIANIALSVIAVFKGETDNSKTVRNVKLALIPWYVINFAMCAVMVAIMFNPFLMVGIPVAIAILMGTAYFYMIATSAPNVGYYLRKVFVKKEEKLTSRRVFTVICHFIFCLDVLGSVLFHLQNKKAMIPPSTGKDSIESDQD